MSEDEKLRRIVAISDFCTVVPPEPVGFTPATDLPPQPLAPGVTVRGGYLERLPLAAVHSGLADSAEIWSFTGSGADPTGLFRSATGPDQRRFRADAHPAPYGSAQMRAHLLRYGPPDILCVWGLGVTADLLDLCARSIKIYNSLDVDALRVTPAISRHFDIFLTGSRSQSDAVRARHPDALVEVLPIGPEFAAPDTFFPMNTPKDIDVIYVAAAQPYKRHDILFDALANLPHKLRALCVIGYGEQAGALRQHAADMAVDVAFVGPPGVSHDAVNRLMNRARVGVVCGVDDGAPAILTEYMLAGLPVLANDRLRCGLQYIRPETGRVSSAADFGMALADMLADIRAGTGQFRPRETVLHNWAWPQTAAKLARLVATAKQRRALAVAS